MVIENIYAGDIVKIQYAWIPNIDVLVVASFLEDRQLLVDPSGNTYGLEPNTVTILERAQVPWEPGMMLRARVDSEFVDSLEEVEGTLFPQLRENVLLIPGSSVNSWMTLPHQFAENLEFEFELDNLMEYEVAAFADTVLTDLLHKALGQAFKTTSARTPYENEVSRHVSEILSHTYRLRSGSPDGPC